MMQIRQLGAIAFAGSMLLSSVGSADAGRRSLSSSQPAGLSGAQQSVASLDGAAGKQARRAAVAQPGDNGGSVAAAAGVCTAPAANCQLQDLNDADNSNRIDFLVAEGFSPAVAGDVVDLCWRGAYDDGTPPPGDSNCQGLAPDTFEVKYYSSVDGAPGALLGSFSQALGTLTVTGPVATGNLVAGFAPEYIFSATHAAVPVTPGQCYWVEISNTLDAVAAPGCVWFWERGGVDPGGVTGDQRGFQDGPPVDGYGLEDLNTLDHALCLSVPLAPAGACYPAPPANDDCANSIAIADGTTFFDTTSATTDGPAEPGCMFVPGGGDLVNQDIWFDYTASCSGDVQVSLCASFYDTNLAIYDGSACPTVAGAMICGDDDCGPNTLQTQVTVIGATLGQALKIRVGGFSNSLTPGLDVGPGSINVACGTSGCPDACAPGAGDCFAGNGSPGCGDVTCCTDVCAIDSFCCCTEWDNLCANLAIENCGSGSVCATATGDCCQDLGTPGCGDSACCLAVCAVDPFCCGTAWDTVCAGEAVTVCDPLCNACPDGAITWLDPADGFLDARQPTDIGDAALLQGVSEISVSGPVGAEALECWSLCETTQNIALHPPGSGANAVVGVTSDGAGGYTLTLAHPLTPGEITKVTYTSTSGTTLSTAALWVLPADVNGDGTSSPADILAVIDSLNGVTPLPGNQTDTDRSTVAGPEDILRVIDLLNGASAFGPWLDATLIDDGLCP
ncbi:MAG: hypothetical protein ACE5E5_02875 [Phycisphaerae bacterium]